MSYLKNKLVLYKTEFTNRLTKTGFFYRLKQKSYLFLSKGKIHPQIRIVGKYIKFLPHFTEKKGSKRRYNFITYLI